MGDSRKDEARALPAMGLVLLSHMARESTVADQFGAVSSGLAANPLVLARAWRPSRAGRDDRRVRGWGLRSHLDRRSLLHRREKPNRERQIHWRCNDRRPDRDRRRRPCRKFMRFRTWLPAGRRSGFGGSFRRNRGSHDRRVGTLGRLAGAKNRRRRPQFYPAASGGLAPAARDSGSGVRVGLRLDPAPWSCANLSRLYRRLRREHSPYLTRRRVVGLPGPSGLANGHGAHRRLRRRHGRSPLALVAETHGAGALFGS